MHADTPTLLDCQNLQAGYGASQVLFGVNLSIGTGEVIGLLGRNGMGKSTTIKCLNGALKPSHGTLSFHGQSTTGMALDAIARLGIATVPEGRQCFPNLSVKEHLHAFADNRSGLPTPWTVERIFEASKTSAGRLMGFGQRLFHVEDPRARIIKRTYQNLVKNGYAKRDAFHDIAQEIEERALADDYFASRQLFPNTNFYASLLLRAINIPPRMFPVITAIGNMPGWIAHWNEETHSPDQRIHRPRQVYMGRKRHAYTPMEKRKS